MAIAFTAPKWGSKHRGDGQRWGLWSGRSGLVITALSGLPHPAGEVWQHNDCYYGAITRRQETLTFEAVVVACRVLVVLLPAGEADLLALGPAGVVAEVVVSRLADDVTVAAVVAAAAHQAVLVLQLPVLAVHPVRARVQALGLGDAVQQLAAVGRAWNRHNVNTKNASNVSVFYTEMLLLAGWRKMPAVFVW